MVIKETIITEVKTRGVAAAGMEFEKFRQKIKVVGDKSSTTFDKFRDSFGAQMDTVTKVNKKAEKSFEAMKRKIRQNKLEEQMRAKAGKMDALIMQSEVFAFKRGKKAIEDITRASRRFKMELLSVMFFGLGIKRFFQGLLQPALDIVGVFDVFTTTLQILFLPVALQILDWALWLMDRVGGLSDFWKKFIGWVALGGVILGTALFLFGMLGLGIAGIVMAFGGLISTVSKLFGGGALGGLMAALLVIIPGLSGLGWISEKLKVIWDSIADSPVGQKIREIWDKIKVKVSDVIDNIKNKLAEYGIKVDDIIKKMGLGEDGFLGIWDKIKKKWDDDIKPMLEGLKESFKKITDNLPSLTTSLNLLVESLKKLGSALEFISKHRVILGILAGGALGSVAGPLGTVVGAVAGGVMAHKTRQYGGYIPQTGLYKLHAG